MITFLNKAKAPGQNTSCPVSEGGYSVKVWFMNDSLKIKNFLKKHLNGYNVRLGVIRTRAPGSLIFFNLSVDPAPVVELPLAITSSLL